MISEKIIDDLQKEMPLNIFKYLTMEDVLRKVAVSKRWQQMCERHWKTVNYLGITYEFFYKNRIRNRIEFSSCLGCKEDSIQDK